MLEVVARPSLGADGFSRARYDPVENTEFLQLNAHGHLVVLRKW